MKDVGFIEQTGVTWVCFSLDYVTLSICLSKVKTFRLVSYSSHLRHIKCVRYWNHVWKTISKTKLFRRHFLDFDGHFLLFARVGLYQLGERGLTVRLHTCGVGRASWLLPLPAGWWAKRPCVGASHVGAFSLCAYGLDFCWAKHRAVLAAHFCIHRHYDAV